MKIKSSSDDRQRCPIRSVLCAAKSGAFTALYFELTADAYKKLAADRGFVWLDITAPGTTASTKWRCPNGHILTHSYNRFQQLKGCQTCLESGIVSPNYAPTVAVRKTAADFHAAGGKDNATWIGETVVNANMLTLW